MKKILKTIKGILLIALIAGTFCLNLNATHSDKSAEQAYQISANSSVGNFLITNTLAAEGDDAAGGDAADTGQNPAPQPFKISDKLKDMISTASDLTKKVFNPAIYFITTNIGNLLGNDYIFGGKMGEMLHAIWVISRNLVNIVFVLILLFLALRHIFGSDENSDLKKVLPKFVIMLIAINFSWLGMRLVLDAANVATNVALSIPSGIEGIVDTNLEGCKAEADGKSYDERFGTKTTGTCVPTQIYMPFDSTEDLHMLNSDCGDGEDISVAYEDAYMDPPRKDNPFYQKTTYCWETVDYNKFSKSNAAYHLTYSMAKVQNLGKASTAQGAEGTAKTGIGTLFAVFIQVVYLITFGSLFIALIFRVAALWFMVAFSPFLVLLYYLSKDLQLDAGLGDKFSFSAFAQWAFAPAKVAVVWAVGFIMITTGQTATKDLFATLDNQSTIGSKVFSVGTLFSGMETLQEVMWLIMTIGIIWIGTFAVLSKLSVIGGVLQQVGDYGTNLAKDIARTPTWAPIIPMIDPNTNKLTLGSASSLPGPRGILRGMEERTTGRASTDHAFEDADKKFRKAATPSQINALNQAGNPEARFKAFQAITGLNETQIKENQGKVAQLLESNGIKDHGTVAEQIVKHAQGIRPQDISVTPKAGGAPLTQEQTTEAFKTAMRQQAVTAKIENWSEADKAKVMSEADTIKKTNPEMSHETAILEAIKRIKPTPRTTGNPPETEPTPPADPGTDG